MVPSLQIKMPVRLLRRFPVLKTVSAYLVINAVADFNEQVLIKKRTRETYKYDKTARITVVGAFVVSPIVFAWMRFAEKLLPGRGLRVVMAKVVLDQLFAAPVEISTFYICKFYFKKCPKAVIVPSKIRFLCCKMISIFSKPGSSILFHLSFEPRREKIGFLHMRKQRRRSASR